jgi:hypothetical protein
MDTKLGIGLATGMFFHAPAGTALPSYPTDTLDAAWTHVGDVTDAGITLSTSKSTTNLKNWANQIKRVLMTDHSETIQSPVMDTTEESLKAVMGSGNVTVTAAATGHGKKVAVNLSADDLPPQEAFLWLMKDGDDMMMIGCSYGQVTSVADVNFAPTAAINWTPTITAEGDGFQLIMEEAAE